MSLAVDTRQHALASLAPATREDEAHSSVQLSAPLIFMPVATPASNPVSPGQSSPPLDRRIRTEAFTPPTRPSSTPFPKPKPRYTDIACMPYQSGAYNHTMCLDDGDSDGDNVDDDGDDVDDDGDDVGDDGDNVGDDCDDDDDELEVAALPALPPQRQARRGISLNGLPAEIHECVLDHLFGFRVSPTSKSSVTRWGTALRHSRRKELSELALVSPAWRVLIQDRLYRHIKVKASTCSLRDSFVYFASHPRLRAYVKHIEIWFPVFQPKYGPLALTSTTTRPTVTADGLTNATYILPQDNTSLEEALYFISETFPDVCILTLEGGERKKAPKVRHWIPGPLTPKSRPMPKVHSVRTLISKGQWNLIRDEDDFKSLMSALPNLQEWHGSYSKPKSKSYLSMAEILQRPLQLKTLNLCLEGDYRRELSFPPYFVKVVNKLHFCSRLALAAASPSLEHLIYTGRVCRQFFIDLVAKYKDPRNGRLKSIDLTVKNCCRQFSHWHESGSGITEMNFIHAFEALVLAGIRSLGRLPAIQYLRIRYVDLDSPVPPLNPYFVLRDGWCSGVWSDAIVAELHRVRPGTQFEDLAESFGEVAYNKDGRMTINPEFPKSRALSLKLSNYALLSAPGAFSSHD